MSIKDNKFDRLFLQFSCWGVCTVLQSSNDSSYKLRITIISIIWSILYVYQQNSYYLTRSLSKGGSRGGTGDYIMAFAWIDSPL